MLGRAAVQRRSGGALGFRIGRRLSPRYGAELTFDYEAEPLALTGASLDAIEATRASFVSTFNGILGTGPFASPIVAATVSTQDKVGHQLAATGVVAVNLLTKGPVISYVCAGAGALFNRGSTPSIELNGSYQFSIVGIVPIKEADKVTLRYATPAHTGVAVFGGGARHDFSRRWGVRGDVRARVGKHRMDNLLDAKPAMTTGTPLGAIFSATNPALVFSNLTTGPIVSSLSGPEIQRFRTFAATGTSIETNAAAGFYWRF